MYSVYHQVLVRVSNRSVSLTSIKISCNFTGVNKVFGKYPLAKILIADAYVHNWVINSLYSAIYLSCIILKYKSEFVE